MTAPAGPSASDPTPRPPGSCADRRERATNIVLVAILAVALALRLFGLNWDEGYDWTPHPDERAILSKVVEISPPGLDELSLLFDSDRSPWNPRWFPYGSFPLYLLKFVDGLIDYIPGLTFDDLRVPARALSGLADVGTIFIVFLTGRALWSSRVGLLAAGLVAVAVIHIQLSHFFAVDTLLALLVAATLFFLIRVSRKGRHSDSALAGLFIGLALATKISVAPVLAAYLVAHLLYASGLAAAADDRPRSILDRMATTAIGAIIGVGVIVAAALIAQPYALLDWDRFYGDFIEQSEMVRRIRDYPYTRQYIDTTPYVYHLQQLATWGLGWPLGLAAWTGFLYTALRGLRIYYGAAYLVVGIVIPALTLQTSNSVLATLLASTVAVGALLATIPLRSRGTRTDVILLSWVVPYFLIVGAFDVKFMRYLVPITPFLLLFASRMLSDVWDYARSAPIGVRIAVIVLAAASAGATLFYGASYTGIYTEQHPAVRAAEWVRENVPRDSLVLKEHWEEGLPGLYEYQIEELPIYDEDRPAKVALMGDLLARADYLALYSNRLYGTVARLDERYPVSRAYYRLLFEGRLGYTVEATFTSYPNLFGVGFVDETFTRPSLPTPAPLVEFRPLPVSLNFGYADESFSVYDHPKVLILKNSERLGATEIAQRIVDGSGGYPTRELPPAADLDPPGRELMLTPQESANRQAGGTWTEIVRTGGWAERLPVLIWIITIEAIALLSVPLCFIVFRPFADRGWLMTKAVGLLMVGLGVWLLASLRIMAFDRTSAITVVLLFAAVNLVLLVLNRHSIFAFLKRHWKTILVAEVVFLVAFAVFVIIRMANPDLWHPWRGGEKPMDFAYLNAVVKSVHMPPYDPWFSGGYLNYYYWGQFLVASLVHLTRIVPDIAVNLAVPTFFAMTAALSYSVVYNLASYPNRGADMRVVQSSGDPPAMSVVHSVTHKLVAATRPSPVFAGLLGAMFVTVLGNLDGAIQVGQSVWRSTLQGLPAGEFDFWRSSRMMPPDPPGHEITEFPFFTFLFADPHAHLWALPFTVLCIGLCASIVLGLARSDSLASVWRPGHLLTVAMLGVAAGALRLLNTWDYPTYILFGLAAIALAEYLAQGGLSGGMIARVAIKSTFVVILGYLVFLPFHVTNETFFIGLESTTNQTPLWQFLAIFGLFVFIVGSYCLSQLRHGLNALWVGITRGSDSLTDILDGRPPARETAGVGVPITNSLVLMAISAALLAGFVLTALFAGSGFGTVIFAGTLLMLAVIVGLRSAHSTEGDAAVTAFVALATVTALAIVIGLDFVRVEGDIERMNSVFKFYLQVWVLLALSGAYLGWRLINELRFISGQRRTLHSVWIAALGVLLLSAAIYPILGTQDRLRDRFDGNVTPLTLDGIAYASGVTYRDQNGAIDLKADFEGIHWLRQNVQGSPVVLEANTPLYRWGGRVSIYTGLPSVIGWQWHQQQQRWDYRHQVNRRILDVERIYSTVNVSEAVDLLNRYQVKYIYVGQVERLYYPERGIEKFETSFSPHLRTAFESASVTIYEFLD